MRTRPTISLGSIHNKRMKTHSEAMPFTCCEWPCAQECYAMSLGPVYTKRQHQRCDNSAMTLAILFSLKTMESLQTGFATHFQATLLFSKRTVSLASSQSFCSVDADAWCKRALTMHSDPVNFCLSHINISNKMFITKNLENHTSYFFVFCLLTKK